VSVEAHHQAAVVRVDRPVQIDVILARAGSPHGPWRISRSPALSFAMPDAFFVTLGLPSLAVR
jgi:RNA-directed DNA polymerase